MNTQILRRAIIGGLFIVPFIPFLVSSSLFFPFITTKAFAWRIIIEVIFAGWILLALLDVNYRPKKSIILYSVILFVALVGLSDLMGIAPLKSFWSNFERMEGYVSLLHLLAFFLVIASVFNSLDWKRWWNTSLVASFLMVLYCALQLLGLKTINQGGVRVDGTLGNAIYLAVYMLFHMFIAGLFLWRNWKNVALRYVYAVLIFMQGIVLYFTATRGAILGLMGGLVVVALLNIGNKESQIARRISISILVSLLIVVGGFFALKNTGVVQKSPVLSRFANLSVEEFNRGGRWYVWPMALKGFKERPILGWGQENFSYIFQEHYDANMFSLEPWFDRAHNIFLDWLVVGGIIGLVAYLLLYVALLGLLWKNESFSYSEKSILTGLVAAYFFHNIFVFDHLISYILFFSLLAYVHRESAPTPIAEKQLGLTWVGVISVPVVIALALTIYFVNIKPYKVNTNLIKALQASQSGGDPEVAIANFKKSYSNSYLGKGETIEQIAGNSTAIFSSNLGLEEKKSYFSFVSQALVDEEKDKSVEKDARYQLLAGSFFASTGFTEEALAHLEKSRKLIPNKQQIYFEIGSAYMNANDRAKAFEAFRDAYNLAPQNDEAKAIYLLGAIYAGDRGVENQLLSELKEKILIFDDRILNAYYANGRMDRVVLILNERIRLDPTNKDRYEEILKSIEK